MKKTILLFLTILTIHSITIAQTFEWAKSMGGTSGTEALSIAVDDSGNVYTTGRFEGTTDFDPNTGTSNLTAVGDKDIFIQKLDVEGNFIWAKSMGGSGWDQARSIALDPSGNVYITGTFVDTVDFDPGSDTVNLISAGGGDFFIQKLNPAGNLLWIKSMGGPNSESGASIVTDNSGDVYITGSFAGTVDFDPNADTTILTAEGDYSIFIQKLDAEGNLLWAKSAEGLGKGYGNSIALDGTNNVYISGSFQGTLDFDPNEDTTNLTSIGDWDIFTQKLDTEGNLLWAKSTGGSDSDLGYDLETDLLGNIYTTGYFLGTVDFDPNAGATNLTAPGGTSDIFLQKLTTEGGFLWAKSMGGAAHDVGYAITVDNLGNIYTTGRFGEVADFDPNSGISELSAIGILDIFIQKLDASGNFLWGKSMGGPNIDAGQSIAVDSLGNVYTTGYFKETADFDPNVATSNLTAVGTFDTFIQKLSQEGNVAIENLQDSHIKLYPNPNRGLFHVELAEGMREADIRIVDHLGRIVYENELTYPKSEVNLSHLNTGIYFITLQTSDGQSASGKIVKE